MRINSINTLSINRQNVQSVNNNSQPNFKGLNVVLDGAKHSIAGFTRLTLAKQITHNTPLVINFPFLRHFKEKYSENLIYKFIDSEWISGLFNKAKLELTHPDKDVPCVLISTISGGRDAKTFAYSSVTATKFILDRFYNAKNSVQIDAAINKAILDGRDFNTRINILGIFSKKASPKVLSETYDSLLRQEVNDKPTRSILPYAVSIISDSLRERNLFKEDVNFLHKIVYGQGHNADEKIMAIIEMPDALKGRAWEEGKEWHLEETENMLAYFLKKDLEAVHPDRERISAVLELMQWHLGREKTLEIESRLWLTANVPQY